MKAMQVKMVGSLYVVHQSLRVEGTAMPYTSNMVVFSPSSKDDNRRSRIPMKGNVYLGAFSDEKMKAFIARSYHFEYDLPLLEITIIAALEMGVQTPSKPFVISWMPPQKEARDDTQYFPGSPRYALRTTTGPLESIDISLRNNIERCIVEGELIEERRAMQGL
jgi:hypothetical protein